MTARVASKVTNWGGQRTRRPGQPSAGASPLTGHGAVRQGAPFAGVALVAVVIELTTAGSSANLPVLTAAALMMVLLLGAALTAPWSRLPTWRQASIPLSFFVVVLLLRHAQGGAAGGYPPLLMLPVIWIALYGTRAQLHVAVGVLSVGLFGPILVLGAPLYPRQAWAVSLLTVAVATFGGHLIHRLVEQSRRRAADVAALGAITRALTAGSDPRPELCAAAALVTGSKFAVLFEPGVEGPLVATAGTQGLDLGPMSIDLTAEVSASAQVWRSGNRLYIADAVADPRASTRLAQHTGAVSVLFEPVTRDGRLTAVLVVGFAPARPRVSDAALEMVELVAAEVAAALDRANLLALLARQARTDPLTGAANRRSWDEALDVELSRAARTGEPLTVALLDMDHFKAYNDTHGHNAGDSLLRDLVTALRAELRPVDVIARWGGEEFALALPGCDLDQAQVIAERLLRVVPDGQTASIGLALAASGDTARGLVGRADRALYAAKHGGRNQVGREVAMPTALLGSASREAR